MYTLKFLDYAGETCINERGTINKEELRKTCQNYYEFDNGLLPTVMELTQPEYLRKPIGDNSKRAKLIYTFETISPSDLLRSKNNGDEPVKRDLALVETLIVIQHLIILCVLIILLNSNNIFMMLWRKKKIKLLNNIYQRNIINIKKLILASFFVDKNK